MSKAQSLGPKLSNPFRRETRSFPFDSIKFAQKKRHPVYQFLSKKLLVQAKSFFLGEIDQQDLNRNTHQLIIEAMEDLLKVDKQNQLPLFTHFLKFCAYRLEQYQQIFGGTLAARLLLLYQKEYYKQNIQTYSPHLANKYQRILERFGIPIIEIQKTLRELAPPNEVYKKQKQRFLFSEHIKRLAQEKGINLQEELDKVKISWEKASQLVSERGLIDNLKSYRNDSNGNLRDFELNQSSKILREKVSPLIKEAAKLAGDKDISREILGNLFEQESELMKVMGLKFSSDRKVVEVALWTTSIALVIAAITGGIGLAYLGLGGTLFALLCPFAIGGAYVGIDVTGELMFGEKTPNFDDIRSKLVYQIVMNAPFSALGPLLASGSVLAAAKSRLVIPGAMITFGSIGTYSVLKRASIALDALKSSEFELAFTEGSKAVVDAGVTVFSLAALNRLARLNPTNKLPNSIRPPENPFRPSGGWSPRVNPTRGPPTRLAIKPSGPTSTAVISKPITQQSSPISAQEAQNMIAQIRALPSYNPSASPLVLPKITFPLFSPDVNALKTVPGFVTVKTKDGYSTRLANLILDEEGNIIQVLITTAEDESLVSLPLAQVVEANPLPNLPFPTMAQSSGGGNFPSFILQQDTNPYANDDTDVAEDEEEGRDSAENPKDPELTYPANLPPEQFPKVTVIQELGRGGLGVAFLVRLDYPEHSETAVLKTISPGKTFHNCKKALINEIEALKKTTLHNIEGLPKIKYAGTRDDGPFLIMERAPGINLKKEIQRRGPLPEKKVITLFTDFSKYLVSLHNLGLLHLDIKPENLMVDLNPRIEGWTMTIIDLGVSRKIITDPKSGKKIADIPFGFKANRSRMVGTYGFMAPEFYRSELPITSAAEVFSLGATLYTALTGNSPFKEDASSVHGLGIIMRNSSNRFKPILEVRPDISPELADLVSRMMETKPENRPSIVEVYNFFNSRNSQE